jgi:hypothetical protein
MNFNRLLLLIFLSISLVNCFHTQTRDEQDILKFRLCEPDQIQNEQVFQFTPILGAIFIGRPSETRLRVLCFNKETDLSFEGFNPPESEFLCVQPIPNRGIFYSTCSEGEFCDQIISESITCDEVLP